MDSYHGTSSTAASVLASGSVNVSLGGGELGRGFYTGQHLYEAKAWAFHKTGDRQKNVVCFDVPDTEVDLLSFQVLDHAQTGLRRYYIKNTGQTRNYLFGVDMVWAPIVGSEKVNGDQYKWESATAEALLNGTKTTKTVI